MTHFPETRRALAQTRELIAIVGFWQWLYLASRLDEAVQWCERVIYCHHNARVLADMEWRLGCVLCDVTRGMSKPYYTLEAMRDEISSKAIDDYNEAYADGRKDALQEALEEMESLGLESMALDVVRDMLKPHDE